MTRRELLKSLFPEVDLADDACDYIRCQHIGKCNTCKYYHYWDEPASLSKSAVKSILNSTYGNNAFYGEKELKYLDTDSVLIQYVGRGEGKTYAQHLELINEGWKKLPSIYNNLVWSTLKAIIDDALDNGFEVRILNGTIYYREKQ